MNSSSSRPLTREEDARVSSRIPGFYKLSVESRHDELQSRLGLSDEDIATLRDANCLDIGRADKMVENCVGVLGLPIGLGLNLRLNARDYVVPMVVEEPSVVAAVSNMARLVRECGGFFGGADPSIMIGQLQILDVADADKAVQILRDNEVAILEAANQVAPNMALRGGGAKEIEVHRFDSPHPMLALHLLIDCVDAMGANAVNGMAEGVAPLVEALTGGRVNLRILSNLADRRCAWASCEIPESSLATETMSGAEVAARIVEAYQFAAVDPYRAATHNKGVMNGIDAVAIATGNDWRGVEAGAHAYAARSGRYTSLTRWWREGGRLLGHIKLPMAIGIVGGSTNVHPALLVLRKVLQVQSAQELAIVMAAVGLAQNLGAIKALATEGIQRGHMTLHARSVALAAGAQGDDVQRVADEMVRAGSIRLDAATLLLADPQAA